MYGGEPYHPLQLLQTARQYNQKSVQSPRERNTGLTRITANLQARRYCAAPNAMFRIYYDDGTCYDSNAINAGPPNPRGVLVIVQDHNEVGKHTQAGTPYYVWRGGRWVAVEDIIGLFDYLMDTGLVLFGRTVTTEEFYSTMKRAIEDMGNDKLGWLEGEKPRGL